MDVLASGRVDLECTYLECTYELLSHQRGGVLKVAITI